MNIPKLAAKITKTNYSQLSINADFYNFYFESFNTLNKDL